MYIITHKGACSREKGRNVKLTFVYNCLYFLLTSLNNSSTRQAGVEVFSCLGISQKHWRFFFRQHDENKGEVMLNRANCDTSMALRKYKRCEFVVRKPLSEFAKTYNIQGVGFGIVLTCII